MSKAEPGEQFCPQRLKPRAAIGRRHDEFEDELTPKQIAELEERAVQLRRHPERGIPWERVRAELKKRVGKSRAGAEG